MARVLKTAPFSAVCWHGFPPQPRCLLFAGTGFQLSPFFSVVCWHGFPPQPRSLLFAGTGFQLSPVLCCLLARVSIQPRSLLLVAMGFIRQPDSPVLCCLLARGFKTAPFSVVCWHAFSEQLRSLLYASSRVLARVSGQPLFFCCLLGQVFRTAPFSVVCWHWFSGQAFSLLFSGPGFQDSPTASTTFQPQSEPLLCRDKNWVSFKFTQALTFPRQKLGLVQVHPRAFFTETRIGFGSSSPQSLLCRGKNWVWFKFTLELTLPREELGLVQVHPRAYFAEGRIGFGSSSHQPLPCRDKD